MKLTSIALSSVFATTILAAPATTKSGKTLSIPVVNIRNRHASSHSKAKGGHKESLFNSVNQYVASIEIGSPPQTVGAAIDTGSSDLWVYDTAAGVENDPSSGLPETYNPSNSSTYKFVSDDFILAYVSESVHGDWVTDNIGLAGVTVKNQRFATVPKAGIDTTGVFGIGLQATETYAGNKNRYDNFPMSLVKQGFIESNAYSIYLDDVDASSGYILFGGIDNAKYSGDLFDVSLVKNTSFTVDVGVKGKQFSGVLDTGTALTYLPQEVMDEISEELGAKWNETEKFYFLDEPTSKELTFDFGSGTITLPSSELSIPASDLGVKNDKYVMPLCSNKLAEEINILGDSFLRSAYVVFDLDNLKVSIGQASFSNDSDIVAITAK